MPSPTPELGLLKGVDADDTADYLVTSLANSLTTVDGLFNNATGHTHGGAHQGGPLAAGSIHNSALASDVARANLLTNGGFEIWQRGNGPFTTNGIVTADFWQHAAAGTVSTSRDTANADGGVGACLSIAFAGTADPTNRLIQSIHLTVEFQPLLGKTVTLSARVKCSVPNSARLGANLNTGSNNYQYGAYHSGSGLYETLTFTTSIATNILYFQPGLYVSTIGNTVYVDNANLVVGSQAADYVPLHPADDVHRCQRYYEVGGDTGVGNIGASGLVAAGGILRTWVTYRAIKPVTPTVTKVGTWLVANCGQPSASNNGPSGCMLSGTGTSANTDTYYLSQAAGCYLTIESNP